MENNIIGTDVNLDTCIQEGYLMLDTIGHKKLKKTYSYNLFCHYPDFIISESKGKIKTHDFLVDVNYSWNEAIQLYNKHKEGLDKFSDDINNKKPSFHDLLSVCDTLNAYCGLE